MVAARARVMIVHLGLAFNSHTLRRHRRWLRAFVALTSRPYANNEGSVQSGTWKLQRTTHLNGVFLDCFTVCQAAEVFNTYADFTQQSSLD